jgi:MFS family permease
VGSFVRRIRGYDRDIRLYFAYTLAANIAIGVFALVFNLYLIQLGQEEDFIGLFNAVQTLAMAGAAVLLGRFIGQFGLWRVVAGGLVLYLLASVLMASVTSPPLLLLLSAFWGASTSMVFTPVMPFVVELTRQRQRQEVAALTMSLISLSTTFGSLIGGWTPLILHMTIGLERPSEAAYRGTMIFGIGLAAFALIPLFMMSSQRRTAKPATVVRPADEDELETDAPPREIRNRMIVYVAVGGLMALGGGAVFPFYNVYLSSIGASAALIGIIFALAWTIAAVIGLWSPWISAKLGSNVGSVIVRLVPVPLFCVMAVSPVLGLAVMAHLIRVSSITVSWSMEGSFISEVLPQRVRYSVFGYRSAAWNLGFSLSSFIAGGVIVRYGYGPSFVTYAVAMTAAMALYYFYFRRIPDAHQLASHGPLPEAPEPMSQSEAAESFTLRPGRGEPAIFVADVVNRVDADEGPSPGTERGTTDPDFDQTPSADNQ